eukprot:750400-Prymnesium_polylepis.1
MGVPTLFLMFLTLTVQLSAPPRPSTLNPATRARAQTYRARVICSRPEPIGVGSIFGPNGTAGPATPERRHTETGPTGTASSSTPENAVLTEPRATSVRSARARLKV